MNWKINLTSFRVPRSTVENVSLQDLTSRSLQEIFLRKFKFLLLILIISPFFVVNSGCAEQSQSQHVAAVSEHTNYKALLSDKSKKLVATWKFPGSEMGPAEMYFWDNGLLVVNSEIFSKQKSENYFLWSLNNDQTLLSITFVDKRIPFSELVVAAESSHLGRHVHSINIEQRKVIYLVRDREVFFFLNWGFYREPTPVRH